ncbi:MAG: hypothetical protein KatS3mg085_232 [Candidatus Dojkabacteria bacterium]|nr:MAG: hypothetical protein KatS3mg085_232 [Candidatus Dojkabacteria bacterium]
MKKNKKGQIVASLTEVKNKTGDIFAIVDQYGEIILTSYNKPRYIIQKIDLEKNLELEEESQKKSKSQNKPKKSQPEQKAETVKKRKSNNSSEFTLSQIVAWNSESEIEKEFIKEILKPIQ